MQISFANQCALLILVLISMYLEVTGELGLLLKPIITVRGGARPISPHPDHFFNQFDLDYGSVDDRRVAGFLNGFITSGKLLSPRQEDPFSQWLFEHVERGKSHADLRTRFVRPKAYYAADFGTTDDLKKDENPKLVIVNHLIKSDADGFLRSNPAPFDLEVREIWQPWLRRKCHFAVRYIIPDRSSILKLMEVRGKFQCQFVLDHKNASSKPNSYIEMNFKPTLWRRIISGRKVATIKHRVDIAYQ